MNLQKIYDRVGHSEATAIIQDLINDFDPKDDTDERFINVIEHLWQRCSLMLMREGETVEDMITVLQDIKNFVNKLEDKD